MGVNPLYISILTEVCKGLYTKDQIVLIPD